MDSFSFALKKLLTVLVMPSTALWLILLFALVLLLLGRKILARSLMVVCVLLTFCLSLYPVSGALLYHWEKQYNALHELPPDTEMIVVLGCLHYQDENQPLSSQVLPCGAIKVVEAVRLWRQQPQVKILLSGGDNEGSGVQHADMLAKLAISLGVPDSKLVRSYQLKDTAEEAANIARRYPNTNLTLITQASHMPRAMRLFAMQGLYPTAAPTYYQVKNWHADLTWQSFIPRLSHIAKADTATYEALAMAWLSIRS
ncbi:membrane protein [Agarivorans sp. Toyoura001]|uniref:YdcF family protein n=1 Tax=Agarivorans sp. Toyoura001 TaxID=2283141 RepID=UPI0010DED6FA|nr:ElyC/SanA/YdcF family protein [Agarivorans sp. Toyoura001]GDY27150.1 membrane protein [Agarivorans sp. Toyoura001]